MLIPTVHPSFVLRGGAGPMAQMRADLVRAKLALAGQPIDGQHHRPQTSEA